MNARSSNRATYNRLRDMLEGQTASAAPKAWKKGAEITSDVLDNVDRHEWFKFAVADDSRQSQIEAVKTQYDESTKRIKDKFEDRKEKLERGDELAPGVLKMVKVFVAVKRKLQPGDKDGRSAREQGCDQSHPARRRHAVPGRRIARRYRA